MNLTKALKQKKKLLANITTLYNKVVQYNLVEVGENSTYNAKEAFDSYLSTVESLITLKTKIHLANAPIYGDIFKLSELKSLVTNLRRLNTKDGKIKGYNQEVTIMIASIDTLTRDKMIEDYEAEIDEIQEKIETFNAITKI